MIARVLHPLLILAICLLLNYPLSTLAFPLDGSFQAHHPVSYSKSRSQHLEWRERGGKHHHPHKKRTPYPTGPADLPGFPALVPTPSPKLPSWVNALLDEQARNRSITMQMPLATPGPSTSTHSSLSWPLSHHEAGIPIQRPGSPLLNQQQNASPNRRGTPILNSSPPKRAQTKYEDLATRRARMALGKAQGRKSPLGRPNPLPNHNHEKRSPAGVPPSSAPAAAWMDKFAFDLEELNPHAPRRPKSPPPMSLSRHPPPSSGAGPSSDPADPSSDPPRPSTSGPPRQGSKSLTGDPPPRIPTNPRRVPGAPHNSPAGSPLNNSPISASAPTWVHNFHALDIAHLNPALDPDPSHAYGGPWKAGGSGTAGPSSSSSGAGPSHGGRPRTGPVARPPSMPRLKSTLDLAALAAAHDGAGPSRSYDSPGAGPSDPHPLRLPKSRSSLHLPPLHPQTNPLYPPTNPLRSPMGRRPRVRKMAPAVAVADADTRVTGFDGSVGELDLMMAKATLGEGGRGRRGGGQVPGGLARELGEGTVRGGLGRGGAVGGGQTVMGARAGAGRGAGGGRGEGVGGGVQGQTGPQSPSKRMREEGGDAERDTGMRDPGRKVVHKGLGMESPRGH